jgi:hypothetical protein
MAVLKRQGKVRDAQIIVDDRPRTPTLADAANINISHVKKRTAGRRA